MILGRFRSSQLVSDFFKYYMFYVSKIFHQRYKKQMKLLLYTLKSLVEKTGTIQPVSLKGTLMQI